MAHDFFYEHQSKGEESAKNDGQSVKPEDSEKVHNFFADDIVKEVEKQEEDIKEAVQSLEPEEKEPLKEVIQPPKEVKQPTIKELRALYGDTSYNIPADAKFKHKANGEEVEVSLQEALNSYSGKVGYDKKFSELDRDRQSYKKDLDTVNKYLNEFATKSKTDPIGAFEFLAEVSGTDPMEFRKNLRGQFISKYGDYLKMDEAARQALELREENEYFKSRREFERKKLADEQAHKEFESKLKNTQTTHNISDDRLNELVNDLRQYGGIDKPSLDDIVSLNIAYSRQDRAMEVLSKINPELLKDDSKLSTLESLLAGNSKLSDAELHDYASKLWGKSEKKAAPKKQQTVSKTSTPTISQKRTIGGGNFDFFK